MPIISGGAVVSHSAEPGVELRAVTPDDNTTLEITTEAEPEPRFPRGLYVGTAGDLAVVALKDADPVVLPNAAVGYHPIRVRKVMATDTAASDIVAVY